ncbi:MAG TPA: BTAD domain-containing putative transcriptional regulator, partial [Candidatus Dormibacteraeota bacterium]|nr:BTAD domain-containing putative transcriptional regulator [Candidatus Dormibacteraeota bacterium]
GFELTRGASTVAVTMGSQRLLAYLALQSHPVQRVHVAGTLWGETTETRSLANLRSTLWRLHEAGVRLVQSVGSGIQLGPEVGIDLRRSTLLARRLIDDSDSVGDQELTHAAFRHDLLPDWYDEWVVSDRERYRQLRMHALEALVPRLLHAARFAEAIEAGQAAVAAEPLRESAHRALIEAHLSEGNPGEALRQYQLFRELLRRELGLEPSPRIRALLAGLRLA